MVEATLVGNLVSVTVIAAGPAVRFDWKRPWRSIVPRPREEAARVQA
jgi:hypothetical protein